MISEAVVSPNSSMPSSISFSSTAFTSVIKGETINRLIKAPERLLATILIANNLVNVTIVILCNFAFNQIFVFHSGVLNLISRLIVSPLGDSPRLSSWEGVREKYAISLPETKPDITSAIAASIRAIILPAVGAAKNSGIAIDYTVNICTFEANGLILR
mgnify:CR=1 FL=1